MMARSGRSKWHPSTQLESIMTAIIDDRAVNQTSGYETPFYNATVRFLNWLVFALAMKMHLYRRP